MSDNQSLQGTWAKLSEVAVKGAQYNSPERHPHPKCLEGTRVDLLKHINGFVDDPKKNQLIWLHGTAGVGKSAVAFTVAERMRGLKVTEETNVEKRLAGTFFFSRETTQRRTAGYFYATLAYQLATNFPNIQKDINRVIRDNPSLLDPNTPLCDQMEALFLKPLRWLRIRLHGCPPLLFVVDALDECTSEPELTDLILSLARALREPDLPVTHILLTSRSESHISKVFQHDEVRPLVREIPVRTSGEGGVISLDGADVDNDICIFLRHSFKELECRHPDFPHPSDVDLAKLASRAGRRFIVASTMMKFIIDDEDSDPHVRLQLMLELTSELLPGTEVYKLYDCILSTCADPKRAYLHLSIVAALVDPLPIPQISTLLGSGLGRDVQKTLLQLRSVMDIPTNSTLPVNIYHSSIRDYVSDPSNCGLPQARDIASPHSLLAYSSLRLMKAIPESMALLDALSELRKQSKAMKPEDPHRLKDSLAFLVRPPEPLSAVTCMLWLRGDRTADLEPWLGTVDGSAWLQTWEGQNWLETQRGLDWLQTRAGRDWLQIQVGRDWPQTWRGQDLQTQAARHWLQIQEGRDWLQTQEGRKWLQTWGGRDWLQIPGGRDWLQTQLGQDWLQTQKGRNWLWTWGGQGWLQTHGGRDWLQTQAGRDWLQTKEVRDWLQTKAGRDWLQTKREEDWLQIRRGQRCPQNRGRCWLHTQVGHDWLQTQVGQDWLQTQRGEDWLQTQGGDWLQTQGGRNWLLTKRGIAWLQTQEGGDWVQTRGGDWLRSCGGQDWLQTQRGRAWLQTQIGKSWLKIWRGEKLLRTRRKEYLLLLRWIGWTWLQNWRRRKWLQSQTGRDWLQSPAGRDWLQNGEGLNWLQSSTGQDWLQSPTGQDWLQSPIGQDWLQTRRGRGWLQYGKGQDWLQSPTGGDWLQTQAGRDWLQTQELQDKLQTQAGRDWLQTQAGQDWLQTPGIAVEGWLQTLAGEDWLQTQAGEDWLQTLGGEDWLQMQAGQYMLENFTGRGWLQTQVGRHWLQTQAGRHWLQTQAGRHWLQTQTGRDWLQTPHGQVWQSSPAASFWVTMEEFARTSEAISEYIIIDDMLLLPAFQVIQQFKTLPDFLMFLIFLALSPSTSALPESLPAPDREIIHAMNAFKRFANKAQRRSQSASDALKYACHNWAVHLSRAPDPWDDTLNHIFRAFWNDHIISWLEMEWCLKGLRSCLVVLSEGQKFVKRMS